MLFCQSLSSRPLIFTFLLNPISNFFFFSGKVNKIILRVINYIGITLYY